MRMKTKTFDCVEMKNRIQAKIMAEYEASRNQFSSFVEFINTRVDRSTFAREMREKFGPPAHP